VRNDTKHLTRHRCWSGSVALSILLVGVPTSGLTDTAAGDRSSGDQQPLFATHSPLNVRIEAPFSTLMRKRPDEEYLVGNFFYTDTSGKEQRLDLKIRTRGKYRHKKETCDFPPLRLNFRKKQVKGTEFAGQDKLKLVTHCQNNRGDFEQYLLREYLAYRILQSMTDYSFGTRLLQIQYVNSEKNGESWASYGFVLEDEKDLGDRIGFPIAETSGIAFEELERAEMNLVSVFLYLVGNTDFSFIRGEHDDICCHNVALYSRAPVSYVPVPYDFDFSGFVNTPYAEPNPKFKLRDVQQRLYRGRCSNNELLDSTLAFFRDKEEVIRQLVIDQDGLDERTRDSTIRFIDGFYDDISSPKKIERNFIDKCS
jgi:hypothetical protein